jgi:hypothetical protein
MVLPAKALSNAIIFYFGAVFCQTIFNALSFAKLPEVANQKCANFEPFTDSKRFSVRVFTDP